MCLSQPAPAACLCLLMNANPHFFLHKSTPFTESAFLSVLWPLDLSQYRKALSSLWVGRAAPASCFLGCPGNPGIE